MDLKKLSLGERIMSLGALLLLVDLVILPWHRLSIGVAGFDVTSSRSGVQSPNGFLGLLAALVAVAVVARIVLHGFTELRLPAIPVTWERADLLAGAAIAGLLVLKLVLETSYLSLGAYLAVPLAGAVAYGGYLRSRETAPMSGTSPTGAPEPRMS